MSWKVFSPIPCTSIRSSGFLKGPFSLRYSTMRSATLGPTRGSMESCEESALLMLTLFVDSGFPSAASPGAAGTAADGSAALRGRQGGKARGTGVRREPAACQRIQRSARSFAGRSAFEYSSRAMAEERSIWREYTEALIIAAVFLLFTNTF